MSKDDEVTELVSDFSVITDPDASKHPAYPAFVKAMKGRMYGRGALNSAWSWFRSGYVACHNEEAPTSAHEWSE